MVKYILMIGDNRERLKEIEPETVNLVVTSPPYAWEFRYSEKKQQLGEIYDTRLFFQELTAVWKLCYKALVPGGYMAIIWADIQDAKKVYGKYCIEPLVEGIIRSMRMANFDLISQWIWRKYEPGASVIVRPYLEYSQMATGYYIPKSGSNWEYVYVWRKPSGVNQPVFDVKESEWYPYYMDGIWNIPYGPEDKDAACFPIELAKRLIKIYTKPGMTVLDPFLGSGTTMRACVDLGRNCIGVEVDVSRLPRIKEKVGWGNQKLIGDIEWVIK
jgi:DNA modification methylase